MIRATLSQSHAAAAFAAAAFFCATLYVEAVSAAGDPDRGRRLARECFACHGSDGNSPSPINPKIGGQHERYLFLSLKQYRDGAREHSLMRGSVLGKTDQDLEDIAAYYAAQPGYLTRREIRARIAEGVPQEQSGPGAGAPQGGGAPPKFDHSDQIALYSSQLAKAFADEAVAAPADESACAGISGDATSDRDGDGLADAFDAAPDDAGEFAADVSGDGVFEICSIQQLEAIGALGSAEDASTPLDLATRLSRSYQIVRDLDASAIENFRPIGDCGPEGNCMISFDRYGFQGTIDGQGHTISGLRVSVPEGGGIGLIGVLGQSGTVRNLLLVDAQVVGRGGTGLLVGSNFGIVYRCRAEGEVAGQLAIGGLVGGSAGLIAFSEVKATVSGNQAIGGLVGDMRGAVYYSTADVEVAASRGAGALVGLNTFGFVVGSHATGKMVGSNDLGGLVGMNTDAKVRASSAAVDIDADGSNIGGLVGFNSLSDVRNSYATGAVSGSDAVGGLVGRNNGSVKRSFAAGTVTGDGATGGISGLQVEGEEAAVYWSAAAQPEGATDLSALSADESGWAPDRSPVTAFIDYYCDADGNGFIDPGEQRPDNYIWQFTAGAVPNLRCTDIAGR
jgi:cytochrome c553